MSNPVGASGRVKALMVQNQGGEVRERVSTVDATVDGVDASVLVTEPAPGVVVLTIANPPVNALSMGVMRGIERGLADRVDQDVRAAIITGGHVFSVGGDLKSTASIPETLAALAAMMSAVRSATFPVIAAVDGHCFGGGFELAIQCDLRIATERALFACSGVRVGWLSPAARLADLVGVARAEQMLLLGRQHTASQLHGLGLLVDVCAPEELGARALKLAEDVAGLAPRSVAATKSALRSWPTRSQAEAGAWFRQQAEALASSEDHAEARSALSEKRPPRFTGR